MSRSFLAATATRRTDSYGVVHSAATYYGVESRAPVSGRFLEMTSVELVFGNADLLRHLLACGAHSARCLCRMAQTSSVGHLVVTSSDAPWLGVVRRSTLAASDVELLASSLSCSRFKTPCVRRALVENSACSGCAQWHLCTRCRGAPDDRSARAHCTTIAQADWCAICEEVVIGHTSLLWCDRCLAPCAACNTRVCTRHRHRDGRCSSCVESEWSAWGTFRGPGSSAWN